MIGKGEKKRDFQSYFSYFNRLLTYGAQEIIPIVCWYDLSSESFVSILTPDVNMMQCDVDDSSVGGGPWPFHPP